MVKESLRITALVTSRMPLEAPDEVLKYGEWEIPAKVISPRTGKGSCRLDTADTYVDTRQHDASRRSSGPLDLSRANGFRPRTLARREPRSPQYQPSFRTIQSRDPYVPRPEVRGTPSKHPYIEPH